MAIRISEIRSFPPYFQSFSIVMSLYCFLQLTVHFVCLFTWWAGSHQVYRQITCSVKVYISNYRNLLKPRGCKVCWDKCKSTTACPASIGDRLIDRVSSVGTSKRADRYPSEKNKLFKSSMYRNPFFKMVSTSKCL